MSPLALPDHWQKAARASSTQSQYQQGLKHFVLAGFTLPSSPDQLLSYLQEQGSRLSATTLALRLSAIGQWHREQGFADPVTGQVRDALTALGRLQRHQPKRKAASLSRDDLKTLLMLCDDDSLAGARDGLAISLGLAAALRRSELAGLTWQDLRLDQAGLSLFMGQADQHGRGRQLVVPPQAFPWDPGQWLQRWQACSGLSQGPLLVAINRGGGLSDRAMTGHGINYLIQQRAAQAGLKGVSAHSLRRAFATLAVQSGVGLADIAAVGRWRSLESLKDYLDAKPGLAIAQALGEH